MAEGASSDLQAAEPPVVKFNGDTDVFDSSGSDEGVRHPDLTSGFGGGVPKEIWTLFGKIRVFFEDNGWTVLLVALACYILWQYLEPILLRYYHDRTAPPVVHVDPRSVESVRAAQQRQLAEASRLAKEQREREKREELLRNAPGGSKLGKEGDAPKPKPDVQPTKKPILRQRKGFGGDSDRGGGPLSGWRGGGGGGGRFLPSRRPAPGGGG